MIRILHMIGSLNIGGSQSMIMNIYRNINHDNIQFDFIVDHPEQIHFATEIKELGGKIYKMPIFTGKNIATIYSAWNRFFTEHGEYKILHSHVRSYACLYLPIAKEHGVKTIIHSHSTSNGAGIVGHLKNILQVPLRFQADYFMACSYDAGKWLFGRKIVKQNNFFVIKNAIDAKKYIFDANTRKKKRNELGIMNEFTLGYIGRVAEPKNPLFVIDVFYELQKRKSDSKLLFVGEGELLSAVIERAEAYGIGNKVIFTGARSDVSELYSAMDVYCFPSLWEGLGISLVEAQASGLRSVCSENIPQEAFVTDLVETLNLKWGSRIWSEKILSYCNYERENTYLKIKDSGFDIKDNVTWMQKFYHKIWNS